MVLNETSGIITSDSVYSSNWISVLNLSYFTFRGMKFFFRRLGGEVRSETTARVTCESLQVHSCSMDTAGNTSSICSVLSFDNAQTATTRGIQGTERDAAFLPGKSWTFCKRLLCMSSSRPVGLWDSQFVGHNPFGVTHQILCMSYTCIMIHHTSNITAMK